MALIFFPLTCSTLLYVPLYKKYKGIMYVKYTKGFSCGIKIKTVNLNNIFFSSNDFEIVFPFDFYSLSYFL